MSTADAFTQLAQTIDQLTAPDGCAWHNVQTHESLIRYLIEETAELVEAIETGAGADEVKEELADVLYQVFFHAAIAEREGEGYDVAEIANTLNQKLIARHPHVFGDRGYMSVDELNAEWEQLKANASGKNRGVLEGIASTMPTLARAEKIVDRLERAGEADAQLANLDSDDVGDAILLLLRQAHADGINADKSLRAALRRIGG